MHQKEHGGGEVVIPLLSLLSFVIFIYKPTAAMRKEPAAKTTIMSAIAIFPSESFLASKPAPHQRVQPPALQNLYNKLKSERNATNEVKKIDKLLNDLRATETPTQLCPESLEHSNGEEKGRDAKTRGINNNNYYVTIFYVCKRS
jgi:hypothetical protein